MTSQMYYSSQPPRRIREEEEKQRVTRSIDRIDRLDEAGKGKKSANEDDGNTRREESFFKALAI